VPQNSGGPPRPPRCCAESPDASPLPRVSRSCRTQCAALVEQADHQRPHLPGAHRRRMPGLSAGAGGAARPPASPPLRRERRTHGGKLPHRVAGRTAPLRHPGGWRSILWMIRSSSNRTRSTRDPGAGARWESRAPQDILDFRGEHLGRSAFARRGSPRGLPSSGSSPTRQLTIRNAAVPGSRALSARLELENAYLQETIAQSAASGDRGGQPAASRAPRCSRSRRWRPVCCSPARPGPAG
jgi:hypothetical protein